MKHILLCAVLLAGTASVSAQAYEFDGFRVEGQGGWDNLKFDGVGQGFNTKVDDKGWVYGAEGGYDMRLSDSMILGVFGNYNWSTVKATGFDGLGGVTTADAKHEWSAMGRLGFKITPSTLLYVAGGYAKTKVDYNYTPVASLVSFDSSQSYGGVRGAVGLEQGLGSHVYAKVEYRYTNYQDGLSRNQVVGGIGVRFGQYSPPPEAAAPPPPPPAPMAEAAPLPPCPPAAVTPGPFLVFFDFDKSLITPEASAILDRAAEQFAATGQVSVALTGNTDTSGSADYNMALSQRRADAVRNYMVGKGVPGGAASATGVGETNLLVQTADGVREPQNRRVEIVFGGVAATMPATPCTPQ
ncbi:OmpA family protein [Polymorphobacter arshaanensis]|uniref:OmpA family protein n=1 Tax=Glacieibacterium arshaanense TaxID=2511025 RepID=UPI00140AB985|nr:OmpA family protein [Polymorphobacter arshaanensis]